MSEIEIRHAARTHVGRVRSQNEDAYLTVPAARLFAVADGLGGHAAGEVASRIAVRALSERFEGRRNADEDAARAAMEAAIREAHARIRRLAAEDRTVAGMGTTLTALRLSADGGFVIGHVGDSRAYRVRGGRLLRLTRDHTYVQEMVDAGRLSEEQARVHPRSSMLTRALGVEGRVEPVIYEGRARPGDRFLLATDGLTGLIPEPELLELLESEEDPAPVARRLVEAANGAGGTDNVTVVLVDVGDA